LNAFLFKTGIAAITLNKLEELDGTYGNIGQVQAGENYIKDQIQKQT
jgi:hypothetical protein